MKLTKEQEKDMSDFIYLTDDGERMTCKMPADETIVEVLLEDNTVVGAFYQCNIMDAGDWDFSPLDDDGEPSDGGNFPHGVVAWRPEPLSCKP